MIEKIEAAWQAYVDGGFKELGFRAANFYLAPPEWIGLINIQEGDTVLDLGGYNGDFTCLAAKKIGPSGRVLTIEPHPQNIIELEERCKIFSNVEIVKGAVAESEGERELIINPENPAGHRLRYQKPGDNGECVGRNQDVVPVKTYTLDGICDEYEIEHIDFIKIDIEGGEIAALQGGDRMLEATSRVMVEAYHTNPDPESEDRTCGPKVYKILHNHRFNVAVTEDYMVFGWKNQSDKAPLPRRILFSIFSGRYGINRT